MYNLHALELKVGEKSTYVVKGLKEFIETMLEGEETLYFGKNFTYDPKVHILSDNDKKIMDILIEVYEMNESLKYSGNSSLYNKFIKGKRIFLTDSQIKRVFLHLKDRPIGFKVQYGENITTSIVDNDIPLEYSILQQNEGFILRQNGPMTIPITRDKEYIFYNDKIYRLSEEQKQVFSAFYNSYRDKREKSIFLSVKDKEEIASYVIPSLRKISYEVKVDPLITQDLYEKPLKVSIYLDKEKEGISAKVKCFYGDVEVNPLSGEGGKGNKGILVRDIIGESTPINTLLTLGFQKQKDKLVLKDEEFLIEFITKHIQTLDELGEIYYSEEFKNVRVHNTPTITSNIKLNEENLLEFDFNIEGINKDELRDVFNAIKEKKKYYKLKKGGFMQLQSDELESISNMFEYLNIKESDFEQDRLLLSRYNALYINETADNRNLGIKKHDSFKKLLSDVKGMKDKNFAPSDNINKIMREYQKFGFKWLKTLSKCGFGGILADEMGLGKTLQTIAFIESELKEKEGMPSLIIVPTSLVYNWQDEIERYAPNLKAHIISGDKKERVSRIKEVTNYDVIITSYPLIRRDIDEYRDLNFKYCILDEAQNIKNPNSMNARAVKEIKAEGYFALTGTPIENSLTELWSIFDFIMPGYLMNHNRFQQKYEIPISKNNNKVALEELNYHIKPFILRRLKKDVIKELPPKIEHKILVEMSKEQKKVYAAYLEQSKDEIESEIQENGFKKSKLKILAVLTRLRQICDDPSTFIDNFKGESGKIEALEDLLEESISSGHRILLFSQFTSVLKNIEKRLKEDSVEYMYLDGKTKMEERLSMVKEFNRGKGKVFLISLKAGGTGLNLTGADTVIHFDPWWNPAVEEQATDRVHRIGQENTVEVIKLIARGTIEEKIYNLQQKKKEIINSIMDSEVKEESLISQMSEEEIRNLLIG
ncbi:ATP-dependent helicase [Clostridium bovifaecis]|uniref:ATP-dependent helicase n=1 Tax=Clostridium bovifaecis TaxID=2184719 RepID=A0A6I6F8N0_9CLOT|nr:ATP-dependent helicase [Clostridium bovifaecis]